MRGKGFCCTCAARDVNLRGHMFAYTINPYVPSLYTRSSQLTTNSTLSQSVKEEQSLATVCVYSPVWQTRMNN